MERKGDILRHLLGILCVIAYEQSAVLLFFGRLHIAELLGYLVQVPFFYFGVFCMIQIWDRHFKWVKAMLTLMSYFLMFFIFQTLCSAIIKSFETGNFKVPMNSLHYKRTLLRGIFIWFVSLAYFQTILRIRKARLARKQELVILEQERNQTALENAFLRSQINPHLLFNSLQFIEYQLVGRSPKALKAIQLLGEVMHYSLKVTAENITVSLQDELTYVRQYIELGQLRNDDRLQFKLEVEENAAVSNLRLPSGIIVNFIENIFKHGDLTEEDDPGTACIAVNGNQLTIQTRNLKRQHILYRKTGIGMQNIRKRLDLLYPERYTLRTTEENNHYNLYFEILL